MGRFFLKIMIKIAKFSYNFGVKNVTNNKDKQTEKNYSLDIFVVLVKNIKRIVFSVLFMVFGKGLFRFKIRTSVLIHTSKIVKAG